MAGATKRLIHALLRASEHVAAGAHGASNEHRLAGELDTPRTEVSHQPQHKHKPQAGISSYLVVHGDERVVWWERAGASFPVNEEGALTATHHVLLNLRVYVPNYH